MILQKIPGSGKPSDEPAAKKRSFGKRTKSGAEPKRTFSGRDQASQAGSSGEKSEGFTTFSQEQDSGDDLVEFRVSKSKYQIDLLFFNL